MKKNHVAVVVGLVMSASLLSGCGSSQSSSSTDTGTIYGEVSEVSDDGITIEVGTMKDNGQEQPGEKPSDDQSSDSNSTDDKSTENNSTDGSTADSASTDDSKSSSDSSDSTKSSDSKQDDGEAPSMLDKTGEEKEITVSSDTEITKESQGGPGQGGPGQGGGATSAKRHQVRHHLEMILTDSHRRNLEITIHPVTAVNQMTAAHPATAVIIGQ